MGAIFYSYSDKSIFKNTVNGGSVPAYIDVFETLVGFHTLCIITQIGVTINDTLQFFPTFGDFIHYYFFGRGVGSITVSGLLFTDCDKGHFPGMNELTSKIGQARGTVTTCYLSGKFFRGPLLDANITVIAEPETHAQFTVNFALLEHDMRGPKPKQPSC